MDGWIPARRENNKVTGSHTGRVSAARQHGENGGILNVPGRELDTITTQCIITHIHVPSQRERERERETTM